MKSTHIRKKIAISFLLVFPAMLLAGFSFIGTVQARENVPILPDARNNWHWNVTANNLLIYETQYEIKSPNGPINAKFLEMVNITGFENKTTNYMGSPELFSYITGEQAYYNVTSDTIETGQAFNITGFQFDSGRSSGEEAVLILLDGQFLPSIVPINATTFDASVMEPILGYAYYIKSVVEGKMNSFDISGSNAAENNVWFENSTDGYYTNMTYFDNGTLKSADAYIAADDGEGGHMDMRVKYNRVFDYNVTKEVDWSVGVGDDLYYGVNDLHREEEQEEINYEEVKITIDEIKTENIKINDFLYDIWQYYQVVYANISTWNWTTQQYELAEDGYIVGMANDLTPLNSLTMFGQDLSRAKGDEVAKNLNVTAFWAYNFTFGPLPQNQNQTWDRTLIEMLDGKDGDPTGVYFVMDYVDDGWAGPNPDADNATMVLSKDWMEGDLYDYEWEGEFGVGDYFNLYNISEDGGPMFFIYPKDTVQEDVQFIFNNDTVKRFGFEEALYPSKNQLIMRNTTSESEMNILYNLTTGFPIRWFEIRENRMRMTLFRKNSTIISGPTDNMRLYADRKDAVEMYLNVTVTGSGDVGLYYALLDFNPTLIPLKNEIKMMPIYVDLYDNRTAADVPAYNITLYYDQAVLDSLNIPESSLMPYGLRNESGEWKWSKAPPEIYEIDTDNNAIYVDILTSEIGNYFAFGTDDPWQFAVEEGDKLKHLTEGTFYNTTSGINIPVIDYSVLNITSIEKTQNTLYPSENFTTVKSESLFWNLSYWEHLYSMDLVSFNENMSSPIKLKLLPGVQTAGIPYIVPLHFGQLNLTIVAKMLNESFYDPYGSMGGLPEWNSYMVNEAENRMTFYNSSGYYLNLTYFDNGSIKEADGYITFYMGPGNLHELEFTLTQKYVKNQSDQVIWGVSEGDILYYGTEQAEFKFKVTSIESRVINLYELSIAPWDTYHTFQLVLGEQWIWNVTHEKWDYRREYLLAAASNHFGAAPGDFHSTIVVEGGPNILFPVGLTGQVLADSYSKYFDIIQEYDTVDFATDEHWRLSGNGGATFTEGWHNKTTGLIDLMFGRRPDFFSLFRKDVLNMTSVGEYQLEWKADTNWGEMNFNNFVNVSSPDAVLSRIFDINYANPTAYPIPSGNVLFYSSIMLLDHTNYVNFTINATLPSGLALSDINITFWSHNASEGWEPVPWSEILEIATLDYANNRIIFPMPTHETMAAIYAWSWVAAEPSDGTGEDEEEGEEDEDGVEDLEIPGYHVTYLFIAMAITSLAIFRKRRN